MLLKQISLLLVIIGAINWGSIGLFELDLVGYLFGGTYSMISRSIFTLVGLAGLYSIYTLITLKDNSQK
ncbi:DUF378 domain-containing protein [Paraclostridium bifermentans]|uniref:DUF378 domain-containing protein n=1 Tax=Paraclostridium bifermentans TaxID=1490 RepID=UPI00359C9A51